MRVEILENVRRSPKIKYESNFVQQALIVFVCFIICLWSIDQVNGQTKMETVISQTDNDPSAYLQSPPNCEVTKRNLDDVAIAAHSVEDRFVIAIARLGDGEKSLSLNRMRLMPVERYLRQRFPEMKYVAAQRNKIKGFGGIELFVGGKLVYYLPFKKNAKSTCSPPYSAER